VLCDATVRRDVANYLNRSENSKQFSGQYLIPLGERGKYGVNIPNLSYCGGKSLEENQVKLDF